MKSSIEAIACISPRIKRRVKVVVDENGLPVFIKATEETVNNLKKTFPASRLKPGTYCEVIDCETNKRFIILASKLIFSCKNP